MTKKGIRDTFSNIGKKLSGGKPTIRELAKELAAELELPDIVKALEERDRLKKKMPRRSGDILMKVASEIMAAITDMTPEVSGETPQETASRMQRRINILRSLNKKNMATIKSGKVSAVIGKF